MKYRILLLLFIIFGQSIIVTSENYDNTPLNIDIQNEYIDTLEFNNTAGNYTDEVIQIIKYLEEYANYTNGKLMGWPFRLNSTIDGNDRRYRGYTAGMAGIGDFLLNAYIQGINESKKLLDEVIYHFMNEYYESKVKGIYWGRFTQELTSGWLGIRYGSSGILKFLINVYTQYDRNDTIINLIEKAVSWILIQEDEDGLPISPNGYITTGWEYGVTGIADTMLDLYMGTDNSTYLDQTLKIADWIIDKGMWNGTKFSVPWTPYGDNSEFDSLIVTGTAAGESGVVNLMLRIYSRTLIEKYKNVAIGIGEDLLYRNKGGYWPHGSISYITNLYSDNTGLTGYFVGSAGIAGILFDLYDLTADGKYLNGAAESEKFIEYFTHNNTVDLGIDLTASQFTGLSKGSAGIAKYALNLYSRYGQDRHIKLAYSILDHQTNLLQKGLIPIDEKEKPNILGYSFNIDEGLAGIGNVYLSAINIKVLNKSDNYNEIYSTATAVFTRDYSISTTETYFYTPFFVLILLFIRRKNKKYNY